MEHEEEIKPVEDDEDEPEVEINPTHSENVEGDDDAEVTSDDPKSYEADPDDTHGADDRAPDSPPVPSPSLEPPSGAREE
jgi:hypothetical protein